jgi:hypothetical protein
MARVSEKQEAEKQKRKKARRQVGRAEDGKPYIAGDGKPNRPS